jgi:hypothetical protein
MLVAAVAAERRDGAEQALAVRAVGHDDAPALQVEQVGVAVDGLEPQVAGVLRLARGGRGGQRGAGQADLEHGGARVGVREQQLERGVLGGHGGVTRTGKRRTRS